VCTSNSSSSSHQGKPSRLAGISKTSSLSRPVPLPPPPSHAPINKPSSLVDAARKELLGKNNTSIGNITKYTTVSSSSTCLENLLEVESNPLRNAKEWGYKGKYHYTYHSAKLMKN
jgi:hypothetical protein